MARGSPRDDLGSVGGRTPPREDLRGLGGSHAAEVGDLLPAPGAGRSALRSSPHVHGEPCCCGPIHVPQSCRKEVPHLDDVPTR